MNAKTKAIMRQAITLLEHDAASYDLTIRFAVRKDYEVRCHDMADMARAALAKVKP